jgi:hypothetical protein
MKWWRYTQPPPGRVTPTALLTLTAVLVRCMLQCIMSVSVVRLLCFTFVHYIPWSVCTSYRLAYRDFGFFRRRIWSLSSGMCRRVVLQKFSDVSEVFTVSVIKAIYWNVSWFEGHWISELVRDHGGSKRFWNVGLYLRDYTTEHPIRQLIISSKSILFIPSGSPVFRYISCPWASSYITVLTQSLLITVAKLGAHFSFPYIYIYIRTMRTGSAMG